MKKALNKQELVLFHIAEEGKLLDVKSIVPLVNLPPRAVQLALSNLERRRLILKRIIVIPTKRGNTSRKIIAGLNPEKIYRTKRVLDEHWFKYWKDKEDWEKIWEQEQKL